MFAQRKGGVWANDMEKLQYSTQWLKLSEYISIK